MQRYRLVVLANAVEGKEEEFNDWYTNVHVPDVLAIPAFRNGQRFKLTAAQRSDAPHPWKYLAIYEFETDDVGGVIAELKSRAGTPQMQTTDTMASGGFVYFFEPITELQHSK